MFSLTTCSVEGKKTFLNLVTAEVCASWPILLNTEHNLLSHVNSTTNSEETRLNGKLFSYSYLKAQSYCALLIIKASTNRPLHITLQVSVVSATTYAVS